MEGLKNKGQRRARLEHILIIFLIVAGNILDLSDYFIDAPLVIFNAQQALCREFRLLGFALLAFKHIPYDRIKIKSFTFMSCIWAAVIIIYNSTLPNIPATFLSLSLYGLYLWWLLRIWFISEKQSAKYSKDQLRLYEISGVAYNILLPVRTFRGLLQMLFIPWKNPLYETRILVADHKITGVSNNKFIQKHYSIEYVEAMIKNGYKIRFCKNYKKATVDKLIGRKIILGWFDCKRLEL